MAVLLTGGAGYIGTHTAVELAAAGHAVVVADNYTNSNPVAVERVCALCGTRIPAYGIDVCDRAALLDVMHRHRIDCVIHFAGFKAVGESVQKPLEYYRNNITSTLTVLECMQQAGIKSLIFSSSATVYGEKNPVPYTETMPRGTCTNPYGWTKSMSEQILEDACTANPDLSVVLLRYFNPIGAHESGRIGEDPRGIPNNLMPYITQVTIGRRDRLTVFGNDYPTPDGTCLRDYIHVSDLASGHAKAVGYALQNTGCTIFNLGTGTPYSVLQTLHAFERATGMAVPHVIGPRRDGDLPASWANTDKALHVLGWKATRTIDDMCRDSWNWQKQNPNGY